MKNIMTILRRDLGYYFTSPIGYIFMIVYVLMSVGLYITSFFLYPVADMRPYFSNLPVLLCVFIPAVTMRVWAEERKENTWELLLTFPMQSRELVLGKFFATLIFYALTLAATFTIPLMLFSLGNPDNGAVLGGYLGTLLLGSFFLSMGIFFSGFFKDQIVAFVVTLLACFGVFMLGMDFIATYLDGVIPGLGSVLSQLLGVTEHFNSFTRGVVEIADLLFFLAWTTIFLLLNIMYIEGRNRPKARFTFSVALTMCMAIGLLFNWLVTDQSIARWDMTEDKIYTVSQASKDILAKLESPVQIKVYITPKDKMPTGMTQLERDITDKIEELRMAAGSKVQYSVVHLEAANVLADANQAPGEEEKDENKAIEKRMLDKGVEPFSVRAMSQDQVTNKLVYSSIGVGYKDQKEEIIPQIMPQNLMELEYRLVSTIYKLTRPEKPVVALVAPKEAMNIDPQYRALLEQMGQRVPQQDDPYIYLEQILQMEKYDVQRVDLSQNSPLPEKYDVLVVVNPRQMNERQRWEINRALVSGKSVIMAVQQYQWDYQITRNGSVPSKRDEKPEVNPLLTAYGLEVSDEVLMDVNSVPLTVQSNANPLAAMLGGGQTVNLPTHILVTNNSMDQDTSITSRLSEIFYLWGSALKVNDEVLAKNGLQSKVLMSTTEGAWTIPADASLTNATVSPPESGTKRFPLMVMVSGQFPDAFKDAARPSWPAPQPRPGQPPMPPQEEAGEAAPVTPAPGKLILMGCSEMFRKNFLQAGNLDLFLNSVDAVALGDELVNVRSRKPINRTIDKVSANTRRLWKIINYALASSIIAGIGISTTAMRRRARNAYTVAHGLPEEAA